MSRALSYIHCLACTIGAVSGREFILATGKPLLAITILVLASQSSSEQDFQDHIFSAWSVHVSCISVPFRPLRQRNGSITACHVLHSINVASRLNIRVIHHPTRRMYFATANLPAPCQSTWLRPVTVEEVPVITYHVVHLTTDGRNWSTG